MPPKGWLARCQATTQGRSSEVCGNRCLTCFEKSRRCRVLAPPYVRKISRNMCDGRGGRLCPGSRRAGSQRVQHGEKLWHTGASRPSPHLRSHISAMVQKSLLPPGRAVFPNCHIGDISKHFPLWFGIIKVPPYFDDNPFQKIAGCALTTTWYTSSRAYTSILADCFDKLSKHLAEPNGAPRRFLCHRSCARDLLPASASERTSAGEEVVWGCVRESDLLQQSGRDRDVMAAPWSPQPEVSAAFHVRCRRSPLRRSVGDDCSGCAHSNCCVSVQVFIFSLSLVRGHFGRSFPTQILAFFVTRQEPRTDTILLALATEDLTSRRMGVH